MKNLYNTPAEIVSLKCSGLLIIARLDTGNYHIVRFLKTHRRDYL